MQTIFSRSIATFGAIVATTMTIAAASPARAATYDATGAEIRTQEVSLAGVDLGTAKGMAQIDRRIRAAAVRVCGRADRLPAPQTLSCRRLAAANAKLSLATKMQQRFAAR
jgi:UrcA family protein